MKKPTKNVKAESLRRALSSDEIKRFFDQCKGNFYEPLFIVALTTGMRFGELALLQVKDIDFDKNIINIQKSKSKNPQKLMFNEQCKNELKNQIALRDKLNFESKVLLNSNSNPVFVSKRGTPVNLSILNNEIKSIIDQINNLGDGKDKFSVFSFSSFRLTMLIRLCISNTCHEPWISCNSCQKYIPYAGLISSYMKVELDEMIKDKQGMDDKIKMIGVAQKKSQVTYAKALNIIKKKIINGEKINFYTIAKEANVSTSFLYGNVEIRELIEKYRKSNN